MVLLFPLRLRQVQAHGEQDGRQNGQRNSRSIDVDQPPCFVVAVFDSRLFAHDVGGAYCAGQHAVQQCSHSHARFSHDSRPSAVHGRVGGSPCHVGRTARSGWPGLQHRVREPTARFHGSRAADCEPSPC